MRISRCIALMLQPRATNSLASQSSSSGWLGGCPGRAEVVGRGDDPFAEVVQPDPVDHHARGQRMAGLGEPFREGQPAAAGRGVLRGARPGERLRRGERLQHARLDFAAGLSVVAALEDRRLRFTRQVVEGADFGECPSFGLAAAAMADAIAADLRLVIGIRRQRGSRAAWPQAG